MRKTIFTISLAAIVALAITAAGADRDPRPSTEISRPSSSILHAKLKTLAESAARNSETLDEKYIKALERIKTAYKSEDRLEDSLAAVNEIHSVSSGQGHTATAIPPSATALLKARQTYERERRKIQDISDLAHIRAVQRRIDRLKKQALRLPTAESTATMESIAQLQSEKEFKAAVSRHKAFLAITSDRENDSRPGPASHSSLSTSR